MRKLKKQLPVYSGLLLAALFTVTANAAGVTEKITPCDVQASHPNDPEKLGEGIGWDNLNVSVALPACEQVPWWAILS